MPCSAAPPRIRRRRRTVLLTQRRFSDPTVRRALLDRTPMGRLGSFGPRLDGGAKACPRKDGDGPSAKLGPELRPSVVRAVPLRRRVIQLSWLSRHRGNIGLNVRQDIRQVMRSSSGKVGSGSGQRVRPRLRRKLGWLERGIHNWSIGPSRATRQDNSCFPQAFAMPSPSAS